MARVFDELDIDFVVLSWRHEAKATAPSHPVEGGASVADHVQLAADTVSAMLVLSDAPVRGSGTSADAAHDALLRLKRARQPVAMTLGSRRFENMVLTALSRPVDSGTANAPVMTVTASEVRRATTRVVRAQHRTAPARKRGKQSSEASKGAAASKGKSLLAKLADAF